MEFGEDGTRRTLWAANAFAPSAWVQKTEHNSSALGSSLGLLVKETTYAPITACQHDAQ